MKKRKKRLIFNTFKARTSNIPIKEKSLSSELQVLDQMALNQECKHMGSKVTILEVDPFL
jgi:hypothetical protein